METFPDDGYMIAWSTNPGKVKVGPWPDHRRWSSEYQCTSGCCYSAFKRVSETDQAQALLNLAAGLMFQGISPDDILREFSQIRIWRDMSVLLPLGRMDRAFIAGRTDWSPHNP